MNEKLIKQVEHLIEWGYGDTPRLDAISDALRNGRHLYPSDQKYLDILISKYLYPKEEDQELKNRVSPLEQKIRNMKGEILGGKRKPQEKTLIEHCSECGSIISTTHNFCPKCGINRDGSSRYKKIPEGGMTNSQKAGIVIGVIITCMFIYASLDLYALSSLQFRSNGSGTFDYTNLSVPVYLEACNPSIFPASYDRISIGLDYQSSNLGHLIFYGNTIPPGSAVPVNGEFKVNTLGILQLFAGGFASALSGQQTTFDPTQLHITSTLHFSVFGIIPSPITISKDYSIDEFRSMMINKTSQFSC